MPESVAKIARYWRPRREKLRKWYLRFAPRIRSKDFIKKLAVRLHLNNHSISIFSNMIYTRLTTKNSACAFVELAYYVFQLSDDYERAIFWIKKLTLSIQTSFYSVL